MASAAPKNRAHFLGRLMPPPAPNNEPYFQGQVVPSPAPDDVFPGAGEMLQYPAPVLGAGYICTRPWKKNGASLKVIYVVVWAAGSEEHAWVHGQVAAAAALVCASTVHHFSMSISLSYSQERNTAN